MATPPLTPARLALEAFRADPRACADGLSVDVTCRGNVLDLNHIGVEPEARGTGVAAAALRALLEHADARGVTVELEVGHDDADIDLIGWYKRHGFAWQGGYMARAPQPVPIPAPAESLDASRAADALSWLDHQTSARKTNAQPK